MAGSRVVKRKQPAKDDSFLFMPGAFREAPLHKGIIHRNPARDLQGDRGAGDCDFEAVYESQARQASQDRCERQASHGGANEHEAFVKRQLESLMFDKCKPESQFDVKETSESVKKRALERIARMEKEAIEVEKLWRAKELERRQEEKRVDKWRDQRLAQLEREKRVAENELAHEKVERKQSKLQRVSKERQRRHQEERWTKLREREAKLAAELEDNLLRERAMLENNLRATNNALRRACNERDYMIQEKEEERCRRLRAEESLHRWKELMGHFPGDPQQQHVGQQQEQQQSEMASQPSLEAQ